MKRIIAFVLCALLALSLASCLQPADNGSQGGNPAKDSKYFFTVAAMENFAVEVCK